MVCYHIGSVDFFPDAYEVRVAGQTEALQHQIRNALVCLVRHRGEVVTRETLLREAWNGRMATDEWLTRCIFLLRKHLRDRELLETVTRIGYRLHHAQVEAGISCLSPSGSPEPDAALSSPPRPSWFC